MKKSDKDWFLRYLYESVLLVATVTLVCYAVGIFKLGG